MCLPNIPNANVSYINENYGYQIPNICNDINNVNFENSLRYSLGGFYIPNYNSFSKYYEKIIYRAGLRYENTGLIINKTAIKEYAATAGLG